MKIYITFFKLFLITTLLFVSSCETIDLDQTEDPSGVKAKFLDPIYTFNYVQLNLPDFVDSANQFTQRVTRQMAMTGGNTYDNAFAAVNSNENWSKGYNILNAIKIMEPKAIQNKKTYELGASKVIRAYILMTMVDIYGDIPVTEALLGNANLTPKFDKSAAIYKQLFVDLDDAISILNQPKDIDDKPTDLYYTGTGNWVTLAKTLKLKMLNNSRLAGSEIGVADIGAAIANILNEGDYIDTPSEDFAFRYGNSRFSPNTRHPLYNDQYEIGGGAYIGNYMMWTMTTEKGSTTDFVNTITAPGDPRVDFYFCKQEPDPSKFANDTFTLPGRSRPVHYDDTQYNSFFDSNIRTCYVVSNWTGPSTAVASNGYWGRDHGDNSGIPPDANLRTCAGVYPVGGAYAPSTNEQKQRQNGGTDGALGAGIMPMLLSSYVHFIKAEAILTLGVAGDAKVELLAGISESITKVITPINNYPQISKTDATYPNYPDGNYLPGTIIINTNNGATNSTNVANFSSFGKINIVARKNYLDFIETNYDSFSATDRLELVIKEYYIAAWGNGIEPYNNYRRTGFPSNFQPTLEIDSGVFYSTAFYPGSSVNNNPNTPNNLRTRKVFWDKATVVLH